LLYHLQVVEELAWVVPEVRPVLDGLVDRAITGSGLSIEEDANIFASELLLPPRFLPAGSWVSGIFMRDREYRPEELIFDALQPLFPTRRERFRGRSLDELRAEAHEQKVRRDLNQADDGSLYEMMQRACLAREDGAAADLSRRVASALLDAIGLHREYIERFFDESVERQRDRWRALLDEMGVGATPPRAEGAVELQPGGRKLLIPPLRWDGADLFPTLPLVPASYNDEGIGTATGTP
jgi:hypothetical protein